MFQDKKNTFHNRTRHPRMSFAALDADVLSVLVEFMDVATFASFRAVVPMPWTAARIKAHGKSGMEALERRQSERIPANLVSGFHSLNRIDAMLCVECRHTPITFIEWKGNLTRTCIPWCTIHVPGPLMDEVVSYCVGPREAQW